MSVHFQPIAVVVASLAIDARALVGSGGEPSKQRGGDFRVQCRPFSPHCVSPFELLGAHAVEMTVTARPTEERLDVGGHFGKRQRQVLVDLSFDQLFLQAAEE